MTLTCELYVKIDAPFASRLDEGWLRRVVEKALNLSGVDYPVELGLVITDSETIRSLNKGYRQRDEATDVLSFALLEDGDASAFVSAPDGVSHLGEVILCYPQAEAQAQERNQPLKRELAHLVVHGVLHLLGHDDEEDGAEARMRAEEERTLEELSDEHLL